MAGGKGTRLASIASDIPKPMVPLCGKPILEYQLECLKKNNLTDIIIVVGHLGSVITGYFGSGGKFGCSISYYSETSPLGTAGALYKMDPGPGDDFILINGDIIFDVDFSRMIKFHLDHNAWATLAVHPNSHPFDSALIVTDNENRVIRMLNKEDPREYYKNRVNSGIHILSRRILAEAEQKSEKADLDRDILKPMVARGCIYAYHSPEYIRDIGTPERFAAAASDVEKGFLHRRNLSQKQRAVFLDRDGTVNKLKGFIRKPEDFELIEGSAGAVKTINRLGYLAIVITNQPVIARGEVSLEELELIHDKMETELGKSGAYLDDIFFCPHHPDKGFPGERPEYKIECECRKPKPGMILRAAKKYNIDLSASYMVGDDIRDAEAGRAACCIPVLLRGKSGAGETGQTNGDGMVFLSLREFAESLARGDIR
jgi:D,D-heptose 1,7-bisphosphate phosphatase